MHTFERVGTRLDAEHSKGGDPGGPPADGGERGAPGGGPLTGDTAKLGLLAFLGTVAMLFIGFTSSLVLRRTASDWVPLSAPPLLGLNTLWLAASSVALELARRRPGARGWLLLTGALALAFVGGQWLVWRQLAALGVFVASSPHSAFFYMLTGVHLLHVGGGLVWYLRLLAGAGRARLDLFAVYWHFLGALWVYLLALLFVF